MTKRYICIQGSPEIPKGSEAIYDNDKYYDINFDNTRIGSVLIKQVERNPECWEEVKEETMEFKKTCSFVQKTDGSCEIVRDECVQECYNQCLAVECGEGECARAIATKFPDLVSRVEEVKEETISPMPAKRWKPEDGEGYWYYMIDGNIISDHWEDTMMDNKMYSVGNIFRTEKEAEAEVMRMKSRSKRWDFVPEESEQLWYYEFFENEVCVLTWTSDSFNINNWNIGNCHRTKEDAEKWGETYAKYFLPPQA